jgi:hypothetical protein
MNAGITDCEASPWPVPADDDDFSVPGVSGIYGRDCFSFF